MSITRTSSSVIALPEDLISLMISITSNRALYSATLSLVMLPRELLSSILQRLPQSDLLSLLLTSSDIFEIVALHLYHSPEFFSTYRFAHFAYTVSKNPYYAALVRVLDVSLFADELDEYGEPPARAGWRDFRQHRNYDWYYNRDKKPTKGSTHPLPSPLLKNFHRTRDLPVGCLCHVLAACTGIRYVAFILPYLEARF